MATDSYTSITNPYEPSKPLACITLGSVIKLLPTNYFNWKLQVEAFLDGYDLLQYLNGSLLAPSETVTTTDATPVTTANPAYQTWRRQDRLIYGALLTTLSNEVASLVSQTKTSQDLWTLLKNTYAKASRSHLKQLKERLWKASKGTQSITTYMHSLKQTGDLLASLGSPISVEDMTDYILCGLDDGYRAVIDVVNARDNSITFDDLLEKLLIQELSITATAAVQQQTPVPLTALHAQARPHYNNNNKPRPAQLPAQPNQRPGNRKPFLGKCQWCNIKGHVLSECRTFRQQHPGIPPPPRNSPQVHTATASLP
jgi:hypothetical protein